MPGCLLMLYHLVKIMLLQMFVVVGLLACWYRYWSPHVSSFLTLLKKGRNMLNLHYCFVIVLVQILIFSLLVCSCVLVWCCRFFSSFQVPLLVLHKLFQTLLSQFCLFSLRLLLFSHRKSMFCVMLKPSRVLISKFLKLNRVQILENRELFVCSLINSARKILQSLTTSLRSI